MEIQNEILGCGYTGCLVFCLSLFLSVVIYRIGHYADDFSDFLRDAEFVFFSVMGLGDKKNHILVNNKMMLKKVW